MDGDRTSRLPGRQCLKAGGPASGADFRGLRRGRLPPSKSIRGAASSECRQRPPLSRHPGPMRSPFLLASVRSGRRSRIRRQEAPARETAIPPSSRFFQEPAGQVPAPCVQNGRFGKMPTRAPGDAVPGGVRFRRNAWHVLCLPAFRVLAFCGKVCQIGEPARRKGRGDGQVKKFTRGIKPPPDMPIETCEGKQVGRFRPLRQISQWMQSSPPTAWDMKRILVCGSGRRSRRIGDSPSALTKARLAGR
jgi:hypothetical protein